MVIKTSCLSSAHGLKRQGHTFFVDTSAVTSLLECEPGVNTTVTATKQQQVELLLGTCLEKHARAHTNTHTHLNNCLCYLIHETKHTQAHRNIHAIPTLTPLSIFTFHLWLDFLSYPEMKLCIYPMSCVSWCSSVLAISFVL